MKQFLQSIAIGIFLATLSFFVARMLGWEFDFSWLEYTAVASSYSCTWLCVKQSRWNYPIGIFTTFLYSILLYKWEMPALAIFNLYLVFSLIYGYFRWGPEDNPLTVTDLKADKWLLGYVGLGIGIYLLLMFIGTAVTWFGMEPLVMSNLDVTAAVLSGVAQFMLDNKRRQTWIVWAVVNVISIYLFYTQGLYLVLFQYIMFLGNTVYGWVSWTKSMNDQKIIEGSVRS